MQLAFGAGALWGNRTDVTGSGIGPDQFGIRHRQLTARRRLAEEQIAIDGANLARPQPRAIGEERETIELQSVFV
jgi:hypothetical protein